MKYIIEENIRTDEMNIKIVMSRCEMYEIIKMLDKIQKMLGGASNGNSKK